MRKLGIHDHLLRTRYAPVDRCQLREYRRHMTAVAAAAASILGHWTLRGSKDPDNVTIDLNSCLFSVIGSQIGQDPLKLRKWTVLKLKDNFQNLAKWLDKIPMSNAGIFLMIGGVNGRGPESPRKSPEKEKYSKRYPAHSQEEDARQLLEDSECVEGEGDVKEDSIDLIGHSREKHVVEGRNGGVETHTRINKCAAVLAFQTEKQQDYALHRALLSKSGQEALHKLDNSTTSSAKVPISELKEQDVEFPKGSNWYAGYLINDEIETEAVILKLRHHKDKRKNKNAKPHIVAVYPFGKRSPIKCYARPHKYRKYIKRLTGHDIVFACTFGKLEKILTKNGYSKRYTSSNTKEDAGQILDNSEGKSCEDDPRNPKTEDFRTGHARNRHVVKRSNGVDGVEAYTRNNRCQQKSAFQTEDDQNYVLHKVLLSIAGQIGLVYLNHEFNLEIEVPASSLLHMGVELPTGSIWHNGEKLYDELEIEDVVLILGHHKNEKKNNSAKPFIITFYPVFKKEKEKAQAAPETASATTSKPASQTPPKRATGAIPKTTRKTASPTTFKTPSKTPPKIALKTATGTIPKTTRKTASPTTSKTPSKTPPKIALKTVTGTIRKTGHVTTPETVHKITPTTSHKLTPKSTRQTTFKITRKIAL
ncbi:uncharacterized protein LOC118646403 isoform X2 [Monomorium pharaonis]|uniref:uncharacterized protein LOC118646403 isoform X2 n=1 Tax=Monomorium pharaonis TaxID=307658 RepID=UPI001746AC7F|nr:uncharacterized protein LOC118646403 isoform X2 [Monomorium pharaonis]XP_036145082.1 uncharacterized protein LOC118646403 isoform X2 [Monomorium pharaonis]